MLAIYNQSIPELVKAIFELKNCTIELCQGKSSKELDSLVV